MKLVIQRCERADVKVDGKTVGEIGKGFLVLLGVGKEDTENDCERLAAKMIGLRIFSDENGKTNLSLKEIGREFEGRDHTTVLHSIERIEKMVKESPETAEIIKDITANINIRYE